MRLTRTSDDEAAGQFDPTYAVFMGLRHVPGAPDRETTWISQDDDSEIVRSGTTVDPMTPWKSLVVWFLAAFDLGPDVAIGYSFEKDGAQPDSVRIRTPDGSAAHVTLAAENGHHQVTEVGPRRLWQSVQTAHERWETLGRPGWSRFGLTARADGTQTVWLDTPTSGVTWPLPS